MNNYETLWKPLNTSGILNHSPETRHNLAMTTFKRAEKIPHFTDKLKELFTIKDTSLQRDIGPLHLENPLGLAAGMLKKSYGLRLREALGPGYLVIGGLTANAQPGNQKPRIFKFPNEQSIVNGMGLPGDGIDAEIMRLEKRKQKNMMPTVPLIANLCTSVNNTTLEGKIDEFKSLM